MLWMGEGKRGVEDVDGFYSYSNSNMATSTTANSVLQRQSSLALLSVSFGSVPITLPMPVSLIPQLAAAPSFHPHRACLPLLLVPCSMSKGSRLCEWSQYVLGMHNHSIEAVMDVVLINPTSQQLFRSGAGFAFGYQ